MRRALEILTPAAETRLSTAATVRAALCLETTLADAVVEALIDRASAAIARLVGVAGAPGATLGRERVRERFVDAPTIDSAPLFLARQPVAALVRVVEDGAETTSGFAGYLLNRNAGLLTKLSGRNLAAWTAAEIVVDYDAGWLLPGQTGRDLPQDLEHACIRWVDAALALDRESERPRVSKETIFGVGAFDYLLADRYGPDGVPPDVKALVAPYRRRSV